MTLPSRLAELRASLHRHGGLATLLRAWKRRRKGFRRIILFGLRGPAEASTAESGFTFRFASPQEAEAWGGTDPGQAARVLGWGDRCLLQLEQERLVGYAWVAVAPVVFVTEGLYLALPDDAAYVYKTYTLPEYRGAGLQPLRTRELLRRLAPEGRRRLFCYVDDTNLASLRGVRKAGYEPVGEVRFHRRGDRVRADVRLAREWWVDVRRA